MVSNEIKFDLISKPNDLSLINDCLKIRETVFESEQNRPPKKVTDEMESKCEHTITTLDLIQIGTCRTYQIDDKTAKWQRIAILKEFRGKGYGKMMADEVLNRLKNIGIQKVELRSWLTAVEFYKSLGFTVTNNEVYMDNGIEHIDMHKQL